MAGCWGCEISGRGHLDAIGVCQTCGGLSCPNHGGKPQAPSGVYSQQFICCQCLPGAITRSAGPPPGGGAPPGGGGSRGGPPSGGSGPSPGVGPSGGPATGGSGGMASALAQPRFHSTFDFQAQFPTVARASADERNSVQADILRNAIQQLFRIANNKDDRQHYVDQVGEYLKEPLSAHIGEQLELRGRPHPDAYPAGLTDAELVRELSARESHSITERLKRWLSRDLKAWMAEINPSLNESAWLTPEGRADGGIDLMLMADAIGLNSYAWNARPTDQPFRRLDIPGATEPGLLVLASIYAAAAAEGGTAVSAGIFA